MQPGSFGDKSISPKVARRTKPRFKGHTKPRTTADKKKISSANARDELEPCDANAKIGASTFRPDEASQSLQIFHVPRRRAASPYQPSSENADLRLQKLIHHCKVPSYHLAEAEAQTRQDTTVVAALTVTPVGPRHEWFPLAAADEALFHAVMSHTAAHSAYLRRVPLENEAEYFWHTGMAIRLVGARLEEGVNKAATDVTICAVCCLTQQQAFSGHVSNTKMHLNGLIQLVQAAGGLQSVTLNPKTRRFILLTDLATSITLQKKFYLEPTFKSRNLTLFFGPASPLTSHYAHTFRARLLNFSASSALSQHAAALFWGLRNLSILLQDFHAGRASPDAPRAEDLQFTDRVEALERLAHSLWYHHHSDSSSSSPDPSSSSSSSLPSPPPPLPIFALLGHAALIYIYTVLRELPPDLGMLALVAARIVSLLEHMPQRRDVLLATFPDLMVWVMFLAGSVVAVTPREKRFLARQVSRVLVVAGGDGGGGSGAGCEESEEAVLRASRRFLWPEMA